MEESAFSSVYYSSINDFKNMKNSQFNSFFPFQNKMIGYNSFSDKFLILDPLLFDLFDSGVKNDNFSELDDIHSEFYHHLIENGFLINRNEDEIIKVKKIRERVDFNEEIYTMVVNPTMNCNFKCWYCYESHIKGSKMNSEMIAKIEKHVISIIESQPNLRIFNLSFFGGEPLLNYKDVVYPVMVLVSNICKKNNIEFNCGFTTNGLLLNETIIKEMNVITHPAYQITLDGDEKRHNEVRFINKKRGSFLEIVSNIILLVKNKCRVTVRINISEETLDNTKGITKYFKYLDEEDKKYIDFSFHKVWQEEKDIDESLRDIVDYFRSKGLNAPFDGALSDAIRNSCYADKKNQSTINFNGDVFKCTARDFKKENREGELLDDGTILWNEKFYERMDIKFRNKPCLSCKILPLCNGGCSQHAIENKDEDYCIHNFNEELKLKLVKDKFLYNLYKN